MKAETNRGILYMDFQHVHPKLEPKLDEENPNPFAKHEEGFFLNQGDAGTYCLIKRDRHDGDVVGQGRSIIHENDKHIYNREKGRKIALKNAMHNMGLARPARTAMWEAYINRKNG